MTFWLLRKNKLNSKAFKNNFLNVEFSAIQLALQSKCSFTGIRSTGWI